MSEFNITNEQYEIEKDLREIGKRIQKSSTFVEYENARRQNESDEELQKQMSDLRIIEINYQAEGAKDKPDDKKMHEFNESFNKTYEAVMKNANMQRFLAATEKYELMINRLMDLLRLCGNGEDPDTCEPRDNKTGCDGGCSGGCSCGGCH